MSRNKQLLRMRRRRNHATRKRARIKYLTERPQGVSIWILMCNGLTATEAFVAQREGLKRRLR